ncbi:MAG: DUF1415 domain-containing protein [Myxococcota bacterium]|jgi:hypothetical protein|nr:DUF1415 domain-containing protein [Myxococcota bacterium]
MSPLDRLEAWLDEAIIGLDLCPFASKVRRAGGVRIATHAITEPFDAVHVTLDEARDLLTETHEGIQTTLVAITRGLEDFETYLDVVATVEQALSEGGADGLLQVATFHPDYRFAPSEAEASPVPSTREGGGPPSLGDYTNRAPYPVLHLLREVDVSDAVDRHPDPGGIPAANIARLEAMGLDRVRELWRRWSESP